MAKGVDVFLLLSTSSAGLKITIERAAAMTMEADADGNGEIDCDEFVRIVQGSDHSERDILWSQLKYRLAVLNRLGHLWNDVQNTYGQNVAREKIKVIKQKMRISDSRRCFFDSSSAFRARWDIVQVVLLIYTAVVVPFRLGFDDGKADPTSPFFIFETFIDVFFIVDIGLNFRTSYYDSEGILVISYNTIAGHYLRTWFIVDVVSCIPFQWISVILDLEAKSKGSGIRLMKIFRLFRLAKMLRLLRLRRILDRYQETLYQIPALMTLMKIGQAVIPLLYGTHVFACFWQLSRSTTPGYLESRFETHASRNVSSSSVSMASLYVSSFWETITDMSQAIDLIQSDSQRMYASVQHVIYIVGVSFLTGTFASVIIAGRVSEQKYHSKMSEIREFLAKKRVPAELRRKITSFCDYVWRIKIDCYVVWVSVSHRV
ncbi:ion transporter [bacterium]|nr:ion transporter [bacterium]